MISPTIDRSSNSNTNSRSVVAEPTATMRDLSSHYIALVRQLLTRQSQQGLSCLCMGLTSCTAGEGVTTTAINLALTAAKQFGRRVLIVDATSERAGVERRLGLEPSQGLAELKAHLSLMGDCISASGVQGLSVLGNGLNAHQTELNLDPRFIRELLAEFKTEFDLIVFDMSHAHEFSDCFTLAEILDGVLLVLEAGKVDSHVARRVLMHFQACHTPVIGTILNKCDEKH